MPARRREDTDISPGAVSASGDEDADDQAGTAPPEGTDPTALTREQYEELTRKMEAEGALAAELLEDIDKEPSVPQQEEVEELGQQMGRDQAHALDVLKAFTAGRQSDLPGRQELDELNQQMERNQKAMNDLMGAMNAVTPEGTSDAVSQEDMDELNAQMDEANAQMDEANDILDDLIKDIDGDTGMLDVGGG